MSQTIEQILALTGEAAALVRQGKLVYLNKSARELLGEDALGKRLELLLGPEVAHSQAHAFLANVTVGGKNFVLRVTEDGGSRIIFLSRPDATPFSLSDPFLYSLRSTLMNIGLAADELRLLAEERGSDEALTGIARLTANYYGLLRLSANTSVALAGAEGTLPCNPCALDLSALFGSVMEGVRSFLPERSFQWELGTGLTAPADPELILNLLSNCLIHGQGSDRIRVGLTEGRGCVVLSVSDNGCGIAPELLHTVFDRYRHSFDVAGMDSGPGLGLTVCQHIARVHGGTLLLESRSGQGTTVRVSLSRSAGRLKLRAPGTPPLCQTRDLLIGLAGCLPEAGYQEKYLD